MVTILSPFCKLERNCFCCFAFFACGLIINIQNTRTIRPKNTNWKPPPPEPPCPNIKKTVATFILFVLCVYVFIFYLEIIFLQKLHDPLIQVPEILDMHLK